VKTSESVKTIATALAKAQAKITHATKDSKNPHFRNDYASLESVIDATKQALLDEGIVVLQGMSEDGSTLTTRLQHTCGEFIESYLKLVLSKQDMQGLGSAITYARRYSLAGMNNIAQQDDDGNDASSRRSVPSKKSASRPPESTDEF
jgi:hypothetical protein